MPTKPNTKPMISNDIVLRYKAVSLFRDAAERLAPLAELAVCERTETRVELCARIFRAVADSVCVSTGEWAEKLILRDENPFSRAAARGERIDDRIKTRVIAELDTFKQLSLIMPCGAKGIAPEFVYGGFSLDYDRLVEYFSANGCGELASSSAFVFADGAFYPTRTDARLSDLADYDEEKSEVAANTENFIKGLPAFHTLLYGDRGTGKSTTVRALANDYAGRLKVIELGGRRIELLPELQHRLSGFKQKHIIFIDDLSFDEDDRGADAFKAALEGSLDSASSNTLIYCTSNRRHLFKETDGETARNKNDERQAELALFDRFGLVVTYVNPDKDGFIAILKSILRRRGMKWREEYASIAEIVALKRGVRSPRTAKQIADLIESTHAENG